VTLRVRTLGRSRQAVVETVDDLAAVLELPDALWVATAATVDTLRLDGRFLAAVDADGDGRVRSDEIRAAIRRAFGLFRDRSRFVGTQTTLALSSLSEAGDGAALRAAARELLDRSPEPGRAEIGLDEVRRLRAEAEATGLSVAGLVLPDAAGDDAAVRAFLEHVIEVTGGEPHPFGAAAVSAAALDAFLAQGRDWLAWTDAPAADPSILPAPETAAALAAHDALAPKFEQYFLLCDAIHLDPALGGRAWIDAAGTDLLDPAAAAALLEKAPLARPRADGVLDPSAGLNPAWRARTAAWLAAAAALGVETQTLDRRRVAEVETRLARHRAWQAARPTTKAGDRGALALRGHLDAPELAVRARALLERSVAAAVALDRVKGVEEAILLQAYLLPLVNTTVSIPDLFDPAVRGWAERGTVVVDGREFHLAIRVNDTARAERFAAMSPLFTMFVKVGQHGGTLDQEYAVPVTAGEREHLVEGMWGVFFDVEGREHHAQIRKLVVNPISIREAVLAPFHRFGEALQSALDKAAAAETEGMTTSVSAAAATTAAAAEVGKAPPAAAPPPAPPPAAPAGPPAALGNLPMLAAGVGIALGAVVAALTQVVAMVGSAAGWLAGAAAELLVGAGVLSDPVASTVCGALFPVWVLVTVLGPLLLAFLLYATPIAAATWFRLRRRDLATLLEGSGWAVNTRLYLDRGLAVRLTVRPDRPR
jgi:hypothetical protein